MKPILERNTHQPTLLYPDREVTNTNDLLQDAIVKLCNDERERRRYAQKLDAEKRYFRKGSYVTLHRGPGVKKMLRAGPAFHLYVYMRMYINRSSKAGTWANLDTYYRSKQLVFARSQRRLAEELEVDRRTIIRWTKRLIESELILPAKPFEQKISRDGNEFVINVYQLGRWDWVFDREHGDRFEVYLFDLEGGM